MLPLYQHQVHVNAYTIALGGKAFIYGCMILLLDGALNYFEEASLSFAQGEGHQSH